MAVGSARIERLLETLRRELTMGGTIFSGLKLNIETITEDNKTLTAADSGTRFLFGSVSTGTITLPTVATAGSGWHCEFWLTTEGEETTITAPGTDLILGHIVTGADNNNRQLQPTATGNAPFEAIVITTNAKKGT